MLLMETLHYNYFNILTYNDMWSKGGSSRSNVKNNNWRLVYQMCSDTCTMESQLKTSVVYSIVHICPTPLVNPRTVVCTPLGTNLLDIHGTCQLSRVLNTHNVFSNANAHPACTLTRNPPANVTTTHWQY